MKKFLYTLLAVTSPFIAIAQIELLPYQALPLGNSIGMVAIADMNNDGRSDIVASMGLSVLVYTQNGQGNLSVPDTFYRPPSGLTSSMSVDDVNNDGLKDIVLAFYDHVGIFFQNAGGSFDTIHQMYSGYHVSGMKTGDLNGDGLKDIAVSHVNETYIRVFYQTSNGFSETTYPQPPCSENQVDIGDINGDGLEDVVLIGETDTLNITVYTQNSSGTLNAYESYYPIWTSFGSSINAVAIGDLNVDGKNDIAITKGGNIPNTEVAMWFQDNSNGNLQTPPVQIPAYHIPLAIEVADLNCDGRNEIIVPSAWPSISIYEMDSNNEFNNYNLFDAPISSIQNPYGLAIGDINGDVKNDVVVTGYDSGLILFINDTDFGDVDTTGISYHQDTVSVTNTLNSYFLTDSTVTYTEAYKMVQFDTFKVTKYSHTDTIKYDTTVITHVFRCEVTFDDTTTVYGMELIETNWRDTVLYSSRIDSIFLLSNHVNLADSQGVSIYPNPSTGKFEIRLDGAPNEQMTQMVVFNNQGQKLFSKSAELSKKGACTIDLSAYPSGSYFVHIELGNQKSITRSLMKM